MPINRNKIKIATGIAILFHLVGLVGLFVDEGFAILTPLNMLVMVVLIGWTQPHTNRNFGLFFLLCFAIGLLAEAVGVRTGLIFGSYAYGTALGWKVMEVPLLIGINWFIVIYCCGISMQLAHKKMLSFLAPEEWGLFNRWRRISLIVDGALLAVFFDWVLEPVAVKLGYWNWLPAGDIPLLNYLTWFGVSCLLLMVFAKLNFNKTNPFALHLLMIELLFFLILRTFL